MKLLLIPAILLLANCTNHLKPKDTGLSRSAEYQQEINEFLAKDAENKKLEREILEEIRIAQENNDEDAFKFFFQEYINVERLAVPEWMKEEPNYVKGGVKVEY